MELEYEILDLGLVYYKNAISDPQSVIDKINDVDKRFSNLEHGSNETDVKPWTPWEYKELHFNDQKFLPESKSIRQEDYYRKEMSEISDKVYSSLEVAFNHYSSELYPFASKNIKGREHSIHLLRYKESGHLPSHIDQGVSTRVLSTVIYLNDDYDGGEIEFVQSGIKIKPAAGSIIFFPSNFLYVHEVHPITRGYRYSMPHWYHNRKDMLFSTGEE
jgi:Rps23 Pro-64 3,4-dihydroxylase Tpa1-like proline 4-hydroxylase